MNPEDYYTSLNDIMKKNLDNYGKEYLESTKKWDMYNNSYQIEEKKNWYEGWDDIEEQIEKYYDRLHSEKNEQPKVKVELKVGDLVTTDDSTRGPIGVVIEVIERFRVGKSHITAVKVLIESEIEAFSAEELWRFYESR